MLYMHQTQKRQHAAAQMMYMEPPRTRCIQPLLTAATLSFSPAHFRRPRWFPNQEPGFQRP